MSRTIGCLLLCFLCCPVLFAQAPSSDQKRETPPALQAVLDRVVGKLKVNDLDGVFAEYRKHAIINNQEGCRLLELNVRNARFTALQSFGESAGVELVSRHAAGDSLLRFVYLEKFEQGAFVWTFTAYRARDEWRFLAINFTNDLDTVFRSGNQR